MYNILFLNWIICVHLYSAIDCYVITSIRTHRDGVL